MAGFLTALTIALVVIVGILSPSADAQERMIVSSETTYRVDLDNNQVLVDSTYQLVHNMPPVDRSDGRTEHWYFDDFEVVIPNSGIDYTISIDGALAEASFSERGSYTYVTSPLVPDLRFGDTKTVTVNYVIPNSGPRAEWGEAEINDEFISLTVWARGSPGQATVHVILPNEYQVDLGAGLAAFTETSQNGETILSAYGIADTREFYGQILAHNADVGLVNTSLTLHAGTGVVLSRPNDPEWRDFAVNALQGDLRVLEGLIGIPWPHGNIVIEQSAEPRVDGFGGWFQSRDNTIKLETTNRETLLHELSHGWFNGSYAFDRWVNEGLSEEFASRVIEATGDQRPDPTWPDPSAAERVPLESWQQPETVTTSAQRAHERYHYNASWWVMRQLTDELGVAAVSKVLVAYNDLPRNERSWQTLFELIDTNTAANDQNLDTLFGTYVANDGIGALQQRRALLVRFDQVFTSTGTIAPAAFADPLRRWDWDEVDRLLDDTVALLPGLEELEALAQSSSLDVSARRYLVEAAVTSENLQRAATFIADDLQAIVELEADRAELLEAASELGLDVEFEPTSLRFAQQDVVARRTAIENIAADRLVLSAMATEAGITLGFQHDATIEDAEHYQAAMQLRLEGYLTRRALADEQLAQLGIEVESTPPLQSLRRATHTLDEQLSVLDLMLTKHDVLAELSGAERAALVNKEAAVHVLVARAELETSVAETALAETALGEPALAETAPADQGDTYQNGRSPIILVAIVLLLAVPVVLVARRATPLFGG